MLITVSTILQMQAIPVIIIPIISIVSIPLQINPQGSELTFLYNPAVSWESHRLFYTSERKKETPTYSLQAVLYHFWRNMSSYFEIYYNATAICISLPFCLAIQALVILPYLTTKQPKHADRYGTIECRDMFDVCRTAGRTFGFILFSLHLFLSFNFFL